MTERCRVGLVGYSYGDGTQPAKGCDREIGHDGEHYDPRSGPWVLPANPRDNLPPAFALGWLSARNS